MRDNDRITEKFEEPPQSRKSKAAIYFMYAALAILSIMVGVFLYWTFQPDDALEIKDSPIPVRTIREHPTADGVVILKVNFCKFVEAEGRVRASFVSESREIFLPVQKDRGPKGCTKTEVPYLIPHDIPGDTYKVKFVVTYKINPIKTITEEFESKPFVIDETVPN